MHLKNYLIVINEVFMSKLDDARKKINDIDIKMAALFEERMKAIIKELENYCATCVDARCH